MSSEPAISARGLGKSYRIVTGEDRPTTAAEAMVRRLRHPLRRTPRERFWALEDIDFDIASGEAVGVIGRNGAGKSTLLKILSRITEPSAGRVRIRGRVGSLLEVGTGFHPELTGRENIFLNGAILGMKRREITQQFDAIVEFSGVERFLEVPVKRYSSGMTVRLAFAVAAHLEPEVLVVDEVLAVGDAEFQSRCLGKMGDVARMDNRTVLFVSHNMAAVETLCTRCIHLEHGKIAFDGDTPAAISHYLSTGSGTVSALPGEFEIPPDKEGACAILRKVRLSSSDGPTETFRLGGDMSITVLAEGLAELPHAVVGMTIRSELDDRLVVLHTDMKAARGTARRADQEEVVFHLRGLPLIPGTYWLDIGVWDHDRRQNVQLGHRAARFSVIGTDVHGSGHSRWEGVAFVRFDWERRPQPSVPDESVDDRIDYKPATAS